MQAIRQTQQLNKRELENATPPSASWHADYRDTAWIYVGGLPLDLTEGDVVTIFSQYGNPTHLNLIRDKDTGKSKGFGFLKYEDQRSCDLAVDNLGGADVLGRLLRVDHTRPKKRDDEDENTHRIDRLEAEAAAENGTKRASDTDESEDERRRRKKRRAMLKDHGDSRKRLVIKADGEESDPMRDYIKQERKDVERSRSRERHRHHHRRRHRDDKDDGLDRRRIKQKEDSGSDHDDGYDRARGKPSHRDERHHRRDDDRITSTSPERRSATSRRDRKREESLGRRRSRSVEKKSRKRYESDDRDENHHNNGKSRPRDYS